MTLTIELTPEQEARLQAAATANGTDPESVLRDFVETLPHDGEKPKTGAEAIAYWEREGLGNPNYGDPSLDSPDLARAIRERQYPPQTDEETDAGRGRAA